MSDQFDLQTSKMEWSPSPATFSQVGFLLAHVDLWGQWLADHPDKADLFKEVFSSSVLIRMHTGWSEDETLEALGCDTKEEKELSALTIERLTTCAGYMSWVEGLLQVQDRMLDKRLVVRAAARFFVLADKDLERVRSIMPPPKETASSDGEELEGDYPPVEYLALGEISRAFKTAARQLPGEGGERARRLHDENPFSGGRTPHLSPKRLEILAGPREEAEMLLGPRVAARMHEHIGFCRICEVAAMHEMEARREAVEATFSRPRQPIHV